MISVSLTGSEKSKILLTSCKEAGFRASVTLDSLFQFLIMYKKYPLY